MIKLLGLVATLAAFVCPVIAHGQKRMGIREEMRIGDLNGIELTGIGDLLVGMKGLVYVTQPSEGIIKVFDRNGRLVRTFGRLGKGPGEFNVIAKLGWKGDTLWVLDSQARRVSFFATPGVFLSSAPANINFIRYPLRPSAPIALLSNGRFLAIPDYVRGTPSKPVPLDSISLVTATGSGKIIDTIGFLSVKHSDMYIQFEESQSHSLAGRQPLSDDPLLAVSPTGDAFVVIDRAIVEKKPHSFSVTRHSVSTNRTTKRTFPVEPIIFSRSLRNAFIEQEVATLVERSNGMFNSVSLKSAFTKALFAPKYYAPIDQALIDLEGRVWIANTLGASQSPRNWTVLDVNSRPIWTVELPGTVNVMSAKGDEVWGVGKDDADVPYVVRYRVLALEKP